MVFQREMKAYHEALVKVDFDIAHLAEAGQS